MRKLSSYLPKTHNELSCEHGFNSSLNFPEANKVFLITTLLVLL